MSQLYATNLPIGAEIPFWIGLFWIGLFWIGLFSFAVARLKPGYQILSIPRKNCGVQSTFFGSGGSTAFRLFAAYRQTHGLGHSNGAAGAFLGLIGLMGLIGQRLTEWQTLFLLIFCGAASALRFSGKKILLITPHPRPICP